MYTYIIAPVPRIFVFVFVFVFEEVQSMEKSEFKNVWKKHKLLANKSYFLPSIPPIFLEALMKG